MGIPGPALLGFFPLCLMVTGLIATHTLALPHLKLPVFFPSMLLGLGPHP